MGEFVIFTGVLGIVVVMIVLLIGTGGLAITRGRQRPGRPAARLARRRAHGLRAGPRAPALGRLAAASRGTGQPMREKPTPAAAAPEAPEATS